MTINELQRRLIGEIERITKDIRLVDINAKPARLKGYRQAVPISPVIAAVPYDEETEDEAGLFPYFIVRVDGVEYQKPIDGMWANLAHVMIAFAIYDDDSKLEGYMSLTSIMERVVERFQGDAVLGPFWCSGQMNMAYQDDDTYPQFFGALEMVWKLPEISISPGEEEFL